MVMREKACDSVSPTVSDSMLYPRAAKRLATCASSPGTFLTSAEMTWRFCRTGGLAAGAAGGGAGGAAVDDWLIVNGSPLLKKLSRRTGVGQEQLHFHNILERIL